MANISKELNDLIGAIDVSTINNITNVTYVSSPITASNLYSYYNIGNLPITVDFESINDNSTFKFKVDKKEISLKTKDFYELLKMIYHFKQLSQENDTIKEQLNELMLLYQLSINSPSD